MVEGIQLAYTNNCAVTGNHIQNNTCGIRLICSSYNDIKENNITGNSQGIKITQEILSVYDSPTQGYNAAAYSSTGNIVTENNITSNNEGVDKR